jgi:gas vesicle protein
MKIDNTKGDLYGVIKTTSEELRERMTELDKYYQDAMEEMSTTIEQVRVMARDSVNAKERELTELMHKQIKSIQNFVDTSVEDMMEERKVTLQKYDKQFN